MTYMSIEQPAQFSSGGGAQGTSFVKMVVHHAILGIGNTIVMTLLQF